MISITTVAGIAFAIGMMCGAVLCVALGRKGRYEGSTINTAFSIKQEKNKP